MLCAPSSQLNMRPSIISLAVNLSAAFECILFHLYLSEPGLVAFLFPLRGKSSGLAMEKRRQSFAVCAFSAKASTRFSSGLPLGCCLLAELEAPCWARDFRFPSVFGMHLWRFSTAPRPTLNIPLRVTQKGRPNATPNHRKPLLPWHTSASRIQLRIVSALVFGFAISGMHQV